MWFLSCDGDIFDGKRIWLRPGFTRVLGRTSGRVEGPNRQRYISHKSVSRQHLLIEVSPVEAGNSSRLHTRSAVKIIDQSKTGSMLDDQKFNKETKILSRTHHTIRLGSYEHILHIKWHPLVFTFTSIPKKDRDATVTTWRDKLEGSDVKLLTDFVQNETTHIIAKKRNTGAVLQALVQARWVIMDSFLDKLTSVMLPDEAHVNQESKLEQDFDEYWPKEAEYIVPTGAEPTPRPDSCLEPNQDRKVMFQDYTFVFLSKKQYDMLFPVISAGGGKALLKETEVTEGAVDEVVKYVKEVAGRKGSEQFKLSQQAGSGGIVLVRIADSGRVEFIRSLDLALDQRSVEQSEFLDAILMTDASGMRRQLQEEDVDAEMEDRRDASRESPPQNLQRTSASQNFTGEVDQPSAQPERHQEPSPAEESAAPEAQEAQSPKPVAKKRARRVITQSRFSGFDDFDPSQFTRPASGSPEPQSQTVSQAHGDSHMDHDKVSQTASRKRAAPASQADIERDMYAEILPSHAAIKRQKIGSGVNGDDGEDARFADDADAGTTSVKATGKQKQVQQMDVMAEVQNLRKKQQEEQRQKDEEALKAALPDGIDISELKDLAIVEEMDLPLRERASRNRAEDGTGERWNPAWNGRKNFKKFRRQGEGEGGLRLSRVMVALEEVPRKGHGIGEEYWLSSTSTSKSRSKAQSQSQSQSARNGAGPSQRESGEQDEDADHARFRRRLEKSRRDEAEDAAREETFAEDIAGRPRDPAIQAAIDSTPSQTFATESQRKASGKRAAVQQGGSVAKKQRSNRSAAASRGTMDDDEDDDDGLKFRRRRH